VNAAVDLALEQSGGLQDAQVFRHCRQGNGEGLGELGDGGFAEGQAGEDGPAGGIGKGPKGGVERGGEIVNHTV
jgi:hypothetical protein